MFIKVDREVLEHEAAIMERQLAQVGPANRFRVIEHGLEIEALAGKCSDGFTGHGGCQDAAFAAAFHPPVLYQVA